MAGLGYEQRSVNSIVKQAYYSIPFSIRARLWRLRTSPRRGFSALLGFVARQATEFRRYLDFRFTWSCVACGHKKCIRYRDRAADKFPFKFYKCRNCDLIFVAPVPNVATYYEGLTMPEFGAGQSTWNRHYLDTIEKHAQPGKLLEIGFGDASFLALARDRGWQTYGAELSLLLARRARDELALPNIEVGTLDTLNYPDNFFDVVAGFNFLEHVANPRETLKSIRRILRPGGVTAIMCPNISGIFHSLVGEVLGENDPLKISWCPPDHLNYFNKTNLRIILEEVGFQVVEDASDLMFVLWQQHEVTIGPQTTTRKLEQLVAQISGAASAKGDERVAEFREDIKKLLVERMTWTMISDLMTLEPILGAENGIFFVARKID